MNAGQFDVGIDYLTITSRHTQDIAGFVESFQKAIPMESGGRPWQFMGYTGESYVADDGHLSWGIKQGHGLCQMSGSWSDKVFRDLEQFRLLNFRCTRLDLAVTTCIPTPRQLVKEAIANHTIANGNYTAIQKTNGEGGTLYVGCRKSDQFGRLYDKGAEIRSRLNKSTVPDAVLWRYEVEYKRSLATAMRDTLAEQVQDHEHLDLAVTNFVHNWFLNRGVSPVFTPSERDSSIVQVASRVTSVQKTLDWLRVQVRPAIFRCSDAVEVSQLLAALGVEVDGSAYVRTSRPTMTPMQLSLWQVDQDPL